MLNGWLFSITKKIHTKKEEGNSEEEKFKNTEESCY